MPLETQSQRDRESETQRNGSNGLTVILLTVTDED